jgi:intracellular multiplication protein IcmO
VVENPGMTHVDGNLVFRQRAAALLQSMAPALRWIRDHGGIRIDAGGLRCAAELESIAALVFEKQFLWSDTDTGDMSTVNVSDIPDELLFPLRAYLGELPGFDPRLPFNQQRSAEPVTQHAYVLMSLPESLESLLV